MNVRSTINTARSRPSRRNKLIAGKMVKNCVAAGCKSTCRDTVSFLKFRSDDHRREQWIRQVRRTRDRWNGPSKHGPLERHMLNTPKPEEFICIFNEAQ